MTVGIMQPYFFPYIGYWQLLAAVDTYVVYDDVNFIKGGWINRNRILNQGQIQYINVQMNGANSFKLINEIEVQQDKLIKEKNRKRLFNAYHKAKYFEEAYPIICDILECEEGNLAKFLINQIRKLVSYIGIDTDIVISSEMKKDNSLKGQDKVIDICCNLGATTYLNAIGGRKLYSVEAFRKSGIELHFLETKDVRYSQLSNEFHPNLSIIDVMMNNSLETIKQMINEYHVL